MQRWGGVKGCPRTLSCPESSTWGGPGRTQPVAAAVVVRMGLVGVWEQFLPTVLQQPVCGRPGQALSCRSPAYRLTPGGVLCRTVLHWPPPHPGHGGGWTSGRHPTRRAGRVRSSVKQGSPSPQPYRYGTHTTFCRTTNEVPVCVACYHQQAAALYAVLVPDLPRGQSPRLGQGCEFHAGEFHVPCSPEFHVHLAATLSHGRVAALQHINRTCMMPLFRRQ